MTRVLYWNLNRFARNKINDALNPDTSAARRALIYDVLRQANADIVVVGEVSAGGGAAGQLAAGDGWLGCRFLLNTLRLINPNHQWRLVPPLVVGMGGRREAVAVFYRGLLVAGPPAGQNFQRFFTGPRHWSNAAPGSSLPRHSAAAAGTYPAAQRADLGPMRLVPGTAQYNGGESERRLAAGIDFWNPADRRGVHTPVDFGGYREPYLCTFCETDGAGNVSRNITLIAVHTSPAAPAATMLALAFSDEVKAALGAAETRIVLGDFNVNLLRPNGDNDRPYWIFPNDYQVALNMPATAPSPTPHLEAYKAYAGTHIRRGFLNTVAGKKQYARFFSTNARTLEYPGFLYFGADPRWPNFYSIDNMLIWQAVRPAGGYGATVANVCVGTPYQDPFGFVAGGHAVPLGTVNFARQLLNPAPGAGAAAGFPWTAGMNPGQAPPLALANPGPNATIMSFANYGRIRSTSDHFAVVADV